LVSAVESLRPGTRRLSHGQQTVLVEYEHVVAQLSPPAFSPPAPEISDFEADGEKLRIYGKHLRQPIAVTVAGFRVPRFAFKEAAARKAAHLEAIVPPEAGAGPVVVLTSGGSAASARPFRAAETMVDAPSDAAPAPKSRARK
jgi:hypothetical protein